MLGACLDIPGGPAHLVSDFADMTILKSSQAVIACEGVVYVHALN